MSFPFLAPIVLTTQLFGLGDSLSSPIAHCPPPLPLSAFARLTIFQFSRHTMFTLSLYKENFPPTSSPGQILFILQVSGQVSPPLRSLPEVLQLTPTIEVITLLAQTTMCLINPCPFLPRHTARLYFPFSFGVRLRHVTELWPMEGRPAQVCP